MRLEVAQCRVSVEIEGGLFSWTGENWEWKWNQRLPQLDESEMRRKWNQRQFHQINSAQHNTSDSQQGKSENTPDNQHELLQMMCSSSAIPSSFIITAMSVAMTTPI